MNPNILDIFFKTARRDIKKKFLTSVFEAILSIVVKGTLNIVMGPISYIFPYSRIVSWFFELGYEVNDELERLEYHKAEYNIKRTKSGIFTAEKIPVTDFNSKLLLPNYYNSSNGRLDDLPDFNYNPYYSLNNYKKNYSFDVLNIETCDKCGSILPDHKIICSNSLNGLFYTDYSKCDECGETGYKHTFSCSKNPIQTWLKKTCKECGEILPDHKITCSKWKFMNLSNG